MAEGDIFDPIWAQDSEDIVPASEAEIRRGFLCGPVTPGRFNWLFQQLQAALNAIGAGNFVQSSRKIDTTEGVSGGGDLTLDRTLKLDLPGLEAKTSAANEDLLVIFDQTATKHKRITRAEFLVGVGGEGGTITGGENVGTGTGSVFKDVASGLLRFRQMLNGGGFDITTVDDDVVFTLADLGAELTVE
jgi:hypothetical protein